MSDGCSSNPGHCPVLLAQGAGGSSSKDKGLAAWFAYMPICDTKWAATFPFTYEREKSSHRAFCALGSGSGSRGARTANILQYRNSGLALQQRAPGMLYGWWLIFCSVYPDPNLPIDPSSLGAPLAATENPTKAASSRPGTCRCPFIKSVLC